MKIAIVWVILLFILGIMLGIYIDRAIDIGKSSHSLDICKSTLYSTCNLTNSIIDDVNMQSNLLESCYNNQFPRLTKLNCELIR